MFKALFRIRIHQFYRETLGIGLFRILFMIVLISFVGFMLFQGTSMFPHVYVTVFIYASLLFFIQVKRKDKHFLKSHFQNYRQIFLLEYLLLSVPLFCCLLYHSQWIAIVVYIVLLLPVVLFDFNYKLKTLNTFVQRWIPNDSFEWKAGVRKTLIILLPVWAIGLCTSFFIGSVPFAILILGIIPLGFYEYGEPLSILIAPELSAKNFVIQKIKRQFGLYATIALPLIVAFLFFYIKYWYIPLAEFFLLASLQTSNVLLKYAFYEPNIKPPAANIYKSVGGIGLILPFFLPLIWIMSLWFYIRSIENLKFYLNDFD